MQESSECKNLVILDGGMSRELIRIKAPFKQPEWSALALMEAPHAVQQIHSEFAAAGADVLTTNSYALVPFHIGEERFQEVGGELAARAGRLARAAADLEYARTGRKVQVAGCLPPVFGSYEPDSFDESRVQDYLSVLVQGLSPYVDLWLGETLSLIAEAKAVQHAVKSTGKPFWVSFTLDDRAEGHSPCLRSGQSVVDATMWIVGSGAAGLLFNCSRPEFMISAIRDVQTVFAREAFDVPVGVYANAFVEEEGPHVANEVVKSTRDDLNREAYNKFARMWVAEGATIIGGCCGIGCEHIRVLAQELRDSNSRT